MRRWFIALITLMIGVMFGYVYKQGEVDDLTKQVTALETKVTKGTEAVTAAATQIEELKAGLDAKTALANEQQAEIEELKAESARQIEMLKYELDGKTTLANERQAKILELEAALKETTSVTTATEPSPTTTPPQ